MQFSWVWLTSPRSLLALSFLQDSTMAALPSEVRLLPTKRMIEKSHVLKGKERKQFLKNSVEQNLLKFKNSSFTALEGDVFIVTYPKCGTTWTQQIAKLIRNNGQEDGVDIDGAFPWIELMSPEEALAVPFPRGFKSHTNYETVPGGEPATTAAKYISVYRNPKDVAVSAYHHARSLFAPGISWDDFFEEFISGRVFGQGKCVDYISGWWKHRDAENILLLSFEWMKANHDAAVAAIAKFMGYELTPEIISAIVDQTKFESMKANPAANMSWVDAYRSESGVTFMRKGKVGDWKNYFTDEQSARMDEEIKRALDGTGLEFQYS